jgi:hypothetical protein
MNGCFGVLLSASLLSLPLAAQEIVMKDGAIHKATAMRREGQFIFYKTLSPNTSVNEGVVGVAQIQSIVFPEIEGFGEARIAAARGHALKVLRITEPLVPSLRANADLPGSQWADVMRLHVPALVVGGSLEAVSVLQKHWISTGDVDLDNAAKVLFLNKFERDKVGLAWAALAKPGASSLGAAIAWLGIGEEALQEKRWGVAIRSFLSVELFVPGQRVLHPCALLGAIKGMLGVGDEVQARRLFAELKSEYPETTEYGAAVELLP